MVVAEGLWSRGWLSPGGRGRRRSQAESRPQPRFRKMMRVGGSDRVPAPREGAWPLPGPLPLTFNPGCWRAFLPPLLVRWAGRPVGRAGVEAACAERRGRSTAGPHLAGAQGTKWDRRLPFIPRGERPP